jgi:hypothetical protein
MSLLDWLLRWWRRPPRAPVILGVRVLAQTMTIAWSLPTKRSDAAGTALPVSEIAGTEVSLSTDGGLGYTVIGNVPPNTTQQFTRPDLADGSYKIRLTVIDTAGRRGVPAIGDAVVKTIFPPAAPVIASITVA